MIGGAVEADHLLQEPAVLRAGHQLIHEARVAKRQCDLGLVDDLGQFAGAQHRHGVDYHGARLGGGQPAGDHRGIVGGAHQHPIAGLETIILDQRMGDAVGPVGEFLVGAPAAVADQRNLVAEAAFDHAVGKLDRGVELLGIVEAVEGKVRPLLRGREIVACERVGMRCLSEHDHPPESVCLAMMTFWTSDAPS